MENNLRERIEAFVHHADQVTADYWERSGFTFAPPPTHRVEYSRRWAKIVTIDWSGYTATSQDRTPEDGRVSGVYGFVCLEDGETKFLGKLKAGDIHMAATFKAPAKHARGSVFAEDFGNCATPHGIKYIHGFNAGIGEGNPTPAQMFPK